MACFTEEQQVEDRIILFLARTKLVRNGRTQYPIVTATLMQITPILASVIITIAEILMLVGLEHGRGATTKIHRAGAIAGKFLAVQVRFFPDQYM